MLGHGMRLQDPEQTKILLVKLPETTPVLEAAHLQEDLRRAGIEPLGVDFQCKPRSGRDEPSVTLPASCLRGPVDRQAEPGCAMNWLRDLSWGRCRPRAGPRAGRSEETEGFRRVGI
jgi:hypothetical protein